MNNAGDRNRLEETHSPYLRQHADNPVHWQPWDDEALALAAEREVPIFLSIGYAACHWCHVMEAESFEDAGIAEILNRNFVPIKVDREERPDLDRVYQTICQLVTASGGWPLSVWLTPDGRPFFVGTYFPPSARMGRPGFGDVLERISESWETDREAIEDRADQWTRAIRDELESVPQIDGAHEPEAGERLRAAADAAIRSADREHGGFGTDGPKFPQPQRIALLLRAAVRFENKRYETVAMEAVDAMANLGVYDHVGGGFHRYATDPSWRIPHFEKMLYDNAELVRVYLDAYQRTEEDRYAQVVRETLEFVERELMHPDGGCYSTLDAQSEGREGAFYVWRPATVREAIEDEFTAELICDRFGITKRGNFEHGASVVSLAASISALAERHDTSEAEVRDRLSTGRQALFAAREERPRPRRDEKVLAGWNGLMISSMAEAGLRLDPRYADLASRALAFVRDHLWDDTDGQLYRRYLDGAVGIDGYLDDYAFLARGAIDVHQSTGAIDALSFAIELTAAFVERCWDPDAGTIYYTPHSGEQLVSRQQDLPDQSIPSSLAVALEVLQTVDHVIPDAGYREIAETVIATHSQRAKSAPLQHPSLIMNADRIAHGGLELTLVSDTRPDQWIEFIATTTLPDRFVTHRPVDSASMSTALEVLGVDDVPPIWAGRTQRDGQPTAYLCRGFTCSPPLTAPGEAREWVDRLGPSRDPGTTSAPDV